MTLNLTFIFEEYHVIVSMLEPSEWFVEDDVVVTFIFPNVAMLVLCSALA